MKQWYKSGETFEKSSSQSPTPYNTTEGRSSRHRQQDGVPGKLSDVVDYTHDFHQLCAIFASTNPNSFHRAQGNPSIMYARLSGEWRTVDRQTFMFDRRQIDRNFTSEQTFQVAHHSTRDDAEHEADTSVMCSFEFLAVTPPYCRAG